MARQIKDGIDYFPLDVSIDDKFELIEAEFGLIGFGVVVKIFQMIYGRCGYYVEWTDEVALLFAKKVGLGGSVVSEIIAALIKRGMFDKDLYDKYRVLTSVGVQKRYFEAISRRKEINVDERILLINAAQICKNVNINTENVDINAKNVDISTQSKVEKRKVEKSKEKKTIGQNPENFAGVINAAVETHGLKKAVADFIEFRESIKKPMTIRAVELLFLKLKKLSQDEGTQIKILEQSILNSWSDVYALKQDHSKGGNNIGKNQPNRTTTTNENTKDEQSGARITFRGREVKLGVSVQD